MDVKIIKYTKMDAIEISLFRRTEPKIATIPTKDTKIVDILWIRPPISTAWKNIKRFTSPRITVGQNIAARESAGCLYIMKWKWAKESLL